MTAALQARPAVGDAPEWAFPRGRSWQLDNGLTGHHVEVRGCGLLDVAVQLQAPLSDEPAGLDGLTDVLARCLQEGSTPGRDAAGLSAALDEIGAELRVSATAYGPQLGVAVPASQAGIAVRLLADLLRGATFPESDVARVVANNLESFAAATADPGLRADRELYRACFTPASRLSRPVPGAPDSVRRIGRADVLDHYAGIAGPGRVRLLSAGDQTPQQIVRLAQAVFGSWYTAVSMPGPPQEPIPAAPAVRCVDRPGSVQAAVRIGAPAVDERHESFADLAVAAHVLGGPITSRLSTSLREEKGYTYGVRADLRPSLRGGVFAVRTLVDHDVTVPALREAHRILSDFREQGLTAGERDDAVAGMLGSAPIAFQTPDRLLEQLAGQEQHDLPVDWLDRHRRAVAATTDDSVAEAFRALVPGTLTTVLVGDAEVLEPQLADAGWTVEVVQG